MLALKYKSYLINFLQTETIAAANQIILNEIGRDNFINVYFPYQN